ncbi:MAG TPA: response regulator [Candidatus Methanoperedens sp.]|nr:response regulator [Candidatus Methanoperedens sp.]
MMRSRRVLVVDDDAVVNRSITRVLGGEGYQVRETMSGLEALAELDHQQYDLVFTDIKMPGMDGLEVTSRVKRAHPEVPVVIITGYGTEANERSARELGVAGFLRKPLTPEMIIDNAARALREREETAEAIRRSALALATLAGAAAPEATGAAAPAAAVEPAKHESRAKNIALFFAAPFIGLAYFLAVPFIGTYAIVKYGWKAITKST